jgi:UDP-glucuronate decarboxylase
VARIVVTGGAGFLGSHLTDALLERGDEVVCIDNLLTGSTTNIEHLFGRKGFTFVEHNVSEFVWVPGPVDAVMHLASPASPVDYLEMPIQTLKVGSLGTHNTLGLAKAKGARFFLASTSEVYGDPLVHPQPETYWGHVNPVGPRGVYDEAKRFAEAMTLAYHRHHGLEVRIVRIFNSVLADEQLLYDDGSELRRETAAQAAERLGANRDLDGITVPAFDRRASVGPAAASTLIAHPTAQRCFEVRTRYGRSIRVTGDHSLFVRAGDGRPAPRPVTQLAVGDRIAVARRIDVPERDRRLVDVLGALHRSGVPPAGLVVSWPGLGETVWARRREVFVRIESTRKPDSNVWRSVIWGEISRHRRADTLPLDIVRALGIAVPAWATVRARTAGRSAALPVVVHISDELLWLLGLWIAEGGWHEQPPKGAFIHLSADDEVLDRAAKVIDRELGVHVVRAPASSGRAAGAFVHSKLLLRLLGDLGFGPGPKRIPGWVLGLPRDRLAWFIEGYRQGDGVHSGLKLLDGRRHEFSTTSDALKDDLIVALARFGLVPSVGRYETTFRSRTGDRRYPFWRLTLAAVSPWSPLEWPDGVEQRLQSPVDNDIVWAAVTGIEEVAGTDLVYDWSVPGQENFWAGTGVFAHNTYGPRMRARDGRVVSNFLVQALAGEPITIYGDGTQTRSFCYVDDEIRGFLALLDSDQTGPINIGNPGEFTMLELADLVKDVTGSDSPIVFEPLPVDDPTQRRPDITLARELLGWEPTIDLREGLTRTAAYFGEQLAGR